MGEEAASRKYRSISLKRSIFLYKSNLTFLPVFFLSSRMTPATPCCTAGSSFLKEIFPGAKSNQNNVGSSGDDKEPEPVSWEG